jgi:hypothetical protein
VYLDGYANKRITLMKKTLFLALTLSIFATARLAAQPNPPPPPGGPAPSFSERVKRLTAAQQADSPELSHFNLDFPGGTPKQLAAAIEKALGKPLNVIVPEDVARTELPPIRVNDVTVPQLFATLQAGSRRYVNGNNELQSDYGFTSIGNGPAGDNTIWNFFAYSKAQTGLTKFSIDFPGGTPRELVAAIQKAAKRPLNAIIPEEFANTKLPPLKMNDVTVSDLFNALDLASKKNEPYVTSPISGGTIRSYQQIQTGYGFRTTGNLSDDSIWYFHMDTIPGQLTNPTEKVSRFYPLAAYLDRGLKIDDITTAVQTAWKMLGETSPPTISFHKDTKLLIAVGAPEKLQVIDQALAALKPDAPVNPVLRSLQEKRASETKTNE